MEFSPYDENQILGLTLSQIKNGERPTQSFITHIESISEPEPEEVNLPVNRVPNTTLPDLEEVPPPSLEESFEKELLGSQEAGREPILEEAIDLIAEENQDEQLIEEVIVTPEVEISVPPLSNPRAEHFYRMACLAKKLDPAGKFNIPDEFINRLAAQNQCFVVESEIVYKMDPIIGPFWPHRKKLIRTLLDVKAKKFEFRAEIRKYLENIATRYRAWLPEEKFPFAGVLHGLRYWLALVDSSTYRPSLLEAGSLLLFFGQESQWNGLELKNILSVQGLSPEEIIELSFRLIRLQKMKNLSLSICQELDNEVIGQVEADRDAVLPLIQRIRFEDIEDTLSRVA
jgi:hypothetical protein